MPRPHNGKSSFWNNVLDWAGQGAITGGTIIGIVGAIALAIWAGPFSGEAAMVAVAVCAVPGLITGGIIGGFLGFVTFGVQKLIEAPVNPVLPQHEEVTQSNQYTHQTRHLLSSLRINRAPLRNNQPQITEESPPSYSSLYPQSAPPLSPVPELGSNRFRP